MHWLNWVFFAVIVVIGVVNFALLARAKTRRRWVWALIALVGAAGIVALATGHYTAGLRGMAMALAFDLFAADHFVQYVQSRRAGSPKNVQLVAAAGWLLFGTFQALWSTGSAS